MFLFQKRNPQTHETLNLDDWVDLKKKEETDNIDLSSFRYKIACNFEHCNVMRVLLDSIVWVLVGRTSIGFILYAFFKPSSF